jgi:recombinational DNA repair ATPase RecF
MLLELNIKDFAIIDRLSLRLEEGFNVLTGETGAGKSIIIDALGTLRGDRADPTFVRAGAERARVNRSSLMRWARYVASAPTQHLCGPAPSAHGSRVCSASWIGPISCRR